MNLLIHRIKGLPDSVIKNKESKSLSKRIKFYAKQKYQEECDIIQQKLAKRQKKNSQNKKYNAPISIPPIDIIKEVTTAEHSDSKPSYITENASNIFIKDCKVETTNFVYTHEKLCLTLGKMPIYVITITAPK